MEPGFAKWLVHVLRRGLDQSQAPHDGPPLHLLFGRGNKLAGKALRNLVAAAHHHHPHGAAEGHVAPDFCHVDPRDVEFSCTTTPSYEPPPMRALFPFRNRGRQGGGMDTGEVALAFEMMNAQEAVAGSSSWVGAAAETPSVAAARTQPRPQPRRRPAVLALNRS
jgi:hypothetical protein